MKIIKIENSQGCLGKNLGCEEAPDKILDELKKNIWTNEEGNEPEFQIGAVKVIKDNLDATNKEIEKASGDIFIGGDHSITFSLFKSFTKDYKNPGLIIFDAHPDCYIDKFLTHENWLKFLIDENIVKKENIVLIGIRNSHVKEIEFLKQNKIKFFRMRQIFQERENVCDTIMEIARDFDGLYLSLDIDVIDPAFAPGTGYLEPAGLSSRDLVYFLQRLKLLKNLKRIDLVEVNPRKDLNNLTVKLAAKLIAELI